MITLTPNSVERMFNNLIPVFKPEDTTLSITRSLVTPVAMNFIYIRTGYTTPQIKVSANGVKMYMIYKNEETEIFLLKTDAFTDIGFDTFMVEDTRYGVIFTPDSLLDLDMKTYMLYVQEIMKAFQGLLYNLFPADVQIDTGYFGYIHLIFTGLMYNALFAEKYTADDLSLEDKIEIRLMVDVVNNSTAKSLLEYNNFGYALEEISKEEDTKVLEQE